VITRGHLEGDVLAADLCYEPSNQMTSLMVVSKQGKNLIWGLTDPFLPQSTFIKVGTTSSSGKPVLGCYANQDIAPAIFDLKSNKLNMLRGSTIMNVKIPANTLEVNCSGPLLGQGYIHTLSASKTGSAHRISTFSDTGTLVSRVNLSSKFKDPQLAVIQSGNGAPEVGALVRQGSKAVLVVFTSSNRRLLIPLPEHSLSAQVKVIKSGIRDANSTWVALVYKDGGYMYVVLDRSRLS